MARIFDPFIDTEDDVLLIRAKCLQYMREGVVTVSWTNEGVSANKALILNQNKLEDIFNATTTFLKEMNPDLYGKNFIKTRPYYTY